MSMADLSRMVTADLSRRRQKLAAALIERGDSCGRPRAMATRWRRSADRRGRRRSGRRTSEGGRRPGHRRLSTPHHRIIVFLQLQIHTRHRRRHRTSPLSSSTDLQIRDPPPLLCTQIRRLSTPHHSIVVFLRLQIHTQHRRRHRTSPLSSSTDLQIHDLPLLLFTQIRHLLAVSNSIDPSPLHLPSDLAPGQLPSASPPRAATAPDSRPPYTKNNRSALSSP